MKLCKDCRFLSGIECLHPKSIEGNDYIKGRDGRPADVMRMYRDCGVEAKLFEQKLSIFKKIKTLFKRD